MTDGETRSLIICAIGLAALAALGGCRSVKRAAPPDPYGPIRSVAEIKRDAPKLAGQVARVRGRLKDARDLNPGLTFPWDVVYTVEDATGSVPVHWFAQEQSPRGRRPPVLSDGRVVVTGRLKRDVELDGKSYPLLIHEATELHNQERPTLSAAPR